VVECIKVYMTSWLLSWRGFSAMQPKKANDNQSVFDLNDNTNPRKNNTRWVSDC